MVTSASVVVAVSVSVDVEISVSVVVAMSVSVDVEISVSVVVDTSVSVDVETSVSIVVKEENDITVTYDVTAGRTTAGAVTVTVAVAEHTGDAVEEPVELGVEGKRVELAKGEEMHLQALLSLEIEEKHLDRKDGMPVVAVSTWTVYVWQKADADTGLFWNALKQFSALLEIFSCSRLWDHFPGWSCLPRKRICSNASQTGEN